MIPVEQVKEKFAFQSLIKEEQNLSELVITRGIVLSLKLLVQPMITLLPIYKKASPQRKDMIFSLIELSLQS